MKSRRGLGSLIASLVLLAATGAVWWQRLAVYDFVRLRGYTPPAKVEALATDTTMSDNTRRLFYVYHPDIEENEEFNDHCKGHEQTIILGCYVKNQGIYIYNVTDPRLNGILEVTAAHEALHAEYDRLSTKDRKRVIELLDQAYAKITDQRIRNTIENYRKAGADVSNELHSILATEARTLTPELENHYKRYFKDRLKVVGYSEQYEKAFTERKNKVTEYDAQLESLKAQINENNTALTAQEAALTVERDQLDRLLAGKQYDAYNAGVPRYNEKIRSYNALVNQTKTQIEQFNSIVAARNALAMEENELYKAIDSRPSTLKTE